MKKIVIALLLIAFCISPAMASDYTFGDDEPVDIVYDVDNDFTGYDFVLAYAGITDEIKLFDPTGAGSQSLKVDNLPSDVTCIAILEGDIVAGFSNGDVRRFNLGSGLFDYSTAGAEDMQLITQLPSACTDIVIDGNKNIFVSSNTYVYKFTYPYYSQSTWYTAPDFVNTIENHPDGLMVGCGNSETDTATLYLYDGSTQTQLYSSGSGAIMGVYSDANGDIYISRATRRTVSGTEHHAENHIYYLKNNAGTYIVDSTLYSIDFADVSTAASAFSIAYDRSYNDMSIESAGVLFTVQPYNDKVSTFSTIGLIGGYYPTAFSSTSDATNPLIDYDGDGEVTQDDAKEFAVSYGPLLWLFMGMIFITAALGGRR